MENIDKKTITELSELLFKNHLHEIEYEAGDVRIRVVAETSGVSMPTVVATPTVPASAPVAKEVKSENQVKSPMVGVVYLSAGPNEVPFVRVGDKIGVGQTLCLIEAMKTFNPVKANKSGTIKEILVESGSPVEFNEPLFVVE